MSKIGNKHRFSSMHVRIIIPSLITLSFTERQFHTKSAISTAKNGCGNDKKCDNLSDKPPLWAAMSTTKFEAWLVYSMNQNEAHCKSIENLLIGKKCKL